MACSCGCRPRPAGPVCGCQKNSSCGGWQDPVARRQPVRILGELQGLIYRKRSSLTQAPRTYLHFFRQPRPLLVRDLSGRRLYILGGCYRITRRGIVG